MFADAAVKFDDQMGFADDWPVKIRLPSWAIFKVPDEFVNGLSLLATQTTVLVGIWLYQMPTYQMLELFGEKKPSSNTEPEETMV